MKKLLSLGLGLSVVVCGLQPSVADSAANPAILQILLGRSALIQANDLTYLGAFALPQGTYGESRFGYGGRGLAPYLDPGTGEPTLFMEGHAWYSGRIAQVTIPPSLVKSTQWDELPQAEVLQEFYSIHDNGWASLGTNSYEAIFGLLPYNGRLIVAATSWYDAACHQIASHGVSSFDLSRTDDFQGFFTINATANARSLGGYMTPIPEEWQEAFGGPVLTGNAALSIIGCISSGPAATVFDPDDLGRTTEVTGKTVLYYPLSNYLVSGGKTQQNTFTFGSQVKGVAFPRGTRSVLFFGRQTMADGYCYGIGTDDPDQHLVPYDGGTYCYDLCDHSKGGHGFPYYHYVWAYDALDLLAVAEGSMEPWEVKPYATWQLNEMDSSGCASIRGAAYDPRTHQLYIAQGFGEQGRIDVYRIEP